MRTRDLLILGLLGALPPMVWYLWPSQTAISDPEEASLRSRIDALAAEVRASAECARPPLRGQKDAPPDEVTAMPLSPSGPLAACFDAVDNRSVSDYLWTTDDDRGARAIPDKEPAAIAAARATCSELVPTLSKWIATGSPCSLRGADLDDDLSIESGLIALSKAAIIEADHLARTGSALAGAQLILDAMLLAQDFGRGEVTLLAAMISTSVTETLARELAGLTLASPRLTADERNVVGQELGRLLKSEPGPANLAPAEELAMLRMGLASVSRDQLRHSEELVASILSLLSLQKLRKSVCAQGMSFSKCVANWDAMLEANTERLELGPDFDIGTEAVRERASRALAEAAAQQTKYLLKRADTVALLVAVRGALGATTGPGCKVHFVERPLGAVPRVERVGDRVRVLAPLRESPQLLLEFQCPLE